MLESHTKLAIGIVQYFGIILIVVVPLKTGLILFGDMLSLLQLLFVVLFTTFVGPLDGVAMR